MTPLEFQDPNQASAEIIYNGMDAVCTVGDIPRNGSTVRSKYDVSLD